MAARPCGFESHSGHGAITVVPRPAPSCLYHRTSRDRGRGGRTTSTPRDTARLRERLTRISHDLKRVRANVRVLQEQVTYLAEVADDAETRKLVAQTPLADREWREAKTDHDRHEALLAEARTEIDSLLAERDRLLERLFEVEGSR